MSGVANIEDIEQEIIEDFSLFESANDKNFYLMDLGDKLNPLDEKYKVDENKIKGCQSQVWLVSHAEGDKIFFDADSDSDITKGLISILIRILSNHSFDEVIKFDLNDFMSRVQLNSFITQRRSNGFLSMVERMKRDALTYKAKAHL
ncbi:SufE family protein [Parafilimonas sp.]|uniref:SufE family protein n=1 Tax=Parafilimonas sp. TaxID=1969739 RepID=UPI003F811E0C